MMIERSDGRVVEAAVSGADDAPVLYFHHGTPSSAYQLRALQAAATKHGLRLVTASRAGYHRTSRMPGRSVADAVSDVEAVLDHLGVDRCVVAGWSGGGPHALATAAVLGDRVAGVLSIAGVAPYDVEGLDFLAGMGEQNIEEFGLALQGEAAVRPFCEAEGEVMKDADAPGLIAALSTLLPEVDRIVMTNEVGEDLAATMREGVAPVDGWIDDDLAFVRPWGFQLSDLAVPAFVWQGTLDLMVPIQHGEWLAAHLPGAVNHIADGEGHLSIMFGYAEQMVGELAGVL